MITSYVNSLTFIEEKIRKRLEENFHYLADLAMEFTYWNCKFPVSTGPNFYINNMLGTFDCFVQPWTDEEAKVPKEAGDICDNALIFAAIWGIGA